MTDPEHSYHSHSSPYYYDAEGIRRHLVPGETLVGWMSTGHTRPLTESEVVESSKENIAIGGSSYACPLAPYHFIAGHSHETPDNNGGVEHTHE